MLKEFMIFIKYPYTAGVIATIWLGSAALMALNTDLPMVRIVSIDMIATVIIASIGFSGQKN
jgi:hypothetical protein